MADLVERVAREQFETGWKLREEGLRPQLKDNKEDIWGLTKFIYIAEAQATIDMALEEAAAWHDKHLKGLMVVQEEHRLNDEPTAVQTQTSGAMAVHRHAAAAIRALKGKT